VKTYRLVWASIAIVTFVLALAVGIVYLEPQPTLVCLCPASLTNKENITISSFRVNSPTNVTVVLSNVGNVTSGLYEYIVKDTTGDNYFNSTLAWPTLAPGAVATVNILLSGKLTGQPFQFQSGQTYSVAVITGRNNQFTNTFTA